jgi:uncharacterized SAM-binding protein YcdF (DUF218 family)
MTATAARSEGQAVRRRRRHVVRWVLLAAVLLPVVYLAVTFVTVWRAAHHDGARPADAIVVLGAAQYDGRPSPALKARLDHVVELWRGDVAAQVVVTGGKQPGDRFTEATASATYLRGQGIPDAKILREVNGRSSFQSLADSAAFLKQKGLTRVVLVSDAYHAARIEGIAEEVGLDASVSPTPASRSAAGVGRYTRETLAVAASRIFGFRRTAGLSNRVRDPNASG